VATHLPGPGRLDRVRALEDRIAAAERHAADLTDRLEDSEQRYRRFLDVLDALQDGLPLGDVLRQLETTPRGRARRSAGGTHVSPGRGVDGVGDAATGGTILLVAEQKSVRLLVHRTLQDAGYKVLIASSGAEAIVLAEHTGACIDVLLTDLAMPDMGGRELANRLSRIQPGMRALFMSWQTAHGDTAVDAVPDADSQLLDKPLTAQLLLPRIRQLISGA
jgi:CheY-like chemotaxis protein